MGYLSLGEALVIAESVTGIPAAALVTGSGVALLDSALHAPQASLAGHELYPAFSDKAAVCAVRIGSVRVPSRSGSRPHRRGSEGVALGRDRHG